jgi:uncharacterized protein YcgL (UPF0745 family)
MYCAVYKSSVKQDTYYLYVARKDDFRSVPEALMQMLGILIHVMDLELNAARKLAQEDVLEVMRNLEARGWHLQMPQRELPTRQH